MKITNHAADRFIERIRSLPSRSAARLEMVHCLLAAKQKHLRKLEKAKRTSMVPTGCCIFICSHGKVVTCLSRFHPVNGWTKLDMAGEE